MKNELRTYMAIASSMGASVPDIFRPKYPEINIESEYQLIQQKKSKLSASKQRWVVAQIEAR